MISKTNVEDRLKRSRNRRTTPTKLLEEVRQILRENENQRQEIKNTLDGINDNSPDSDGDGIPNGQDDDYVRPTDGSGSMNGNGNGGGTGTGDCDGTGPQGSGRRGGRN